MLVEVQKPLSDASLQPAIKAATHKVEEFIDDWLVLIADNLTSGCVKEVIARAQKLQEMWHVDWPGYHLILQLLLVLAPLTPLVEHLELEPDEFKATLGVETDKFQESIERDLYGTIWSAPFKFLDTSYEPCPCLCLLTPPGFAEISTMPTGQRVRPTF